jgi:RNA polymerase sigma factor (sigma-70 family)
MTEHLNNEADAAVVYVVDDERAMRESLCLLLRSVGLTVMAFECAEDLLTLPAPDVPACVIMDVRLKGQSGLVAQQRLNSAHNPLPVIFMSAHGDIEMSVKAMKRGAVDFLAKPFREQDLLDAVAEALGAERERRAADHARRAIQDQYESLTERERDVMTLTVSGLRNREIAEKLHLSEATIKIYRSQAMKKMHVRSVAELVSKAHRLQQGSPLTGVGKTHVV